MSDIGFFQTPRYVGGYQMGQAPATYTFNLTRRPSRWHRFWVRAVLGWRWVDAP